MDKYIQDKKRLYLIRTLSRTKRKDYKGMQRCFFDIGNDYQILCPKLEVANQLIHDKYVKKILDMNLCGDSQASLLP